MKPLSIAIIGTGPAGLMATDSALAQGHRATVFDRRKAAGRKLLIAGSSGLNISNALPLDDFIAHYTPKHPLIENSLRTFPPEAWIRFINEIGLETFLGTSDRYFVKDMKAARFVRTWLDRLAQKGARFFYDHECTRFERQADGQISLMFNGSSFSESFDRVVFALGGGSYDDDGSAERWPHLFQQHGIRFNSFRAANVGYRVAWSEAFLKEAEGKPIKNAVFRTMRGSRMGEAVITQYGIEGTPIYFVGTEGNLTIDLKPSFSSDEIVSKLQFVRENLSPLRRAKKKLALSEAALALLFHYGSRVAENDLVSFAAQIKAFPLTLLGPQPLSEAISSSGGIALDELDERYMLKKVPGVYAVGEMLDWDAPTGGFLIQLCASQGYSVSRSLLQP